MSIEALPDEILHQAYGALTWYRPSPAEVERVCDMVWNARGKADAGLLGQCLKALEKVGDLEAYPEETRQVLDEIRNQDVKP